MRQCTASNSSCLKLQLHLLWGNDGHFFLQRFVHNISSQLHNYGRLGMKIKGAPRLELNRFIREHKASWYELEQLLRQMNRKKSNLQAEHIDRFTELYKAASAK